MTEKPWFEHAWYGSEANIDAARAALPQDSAIIGALVPPLNEPLRVWDGMAIILFRADAERALPAGVRSRPELAHALLGTLGVEDAP